MRSPWLVTVRLCTTSLFVLGLFFCSFTPITSAQDTPSSAVVAEEEVAITEEEEGEEAYTPGGASVTAIVPETPFNTKNSLLAKLSYPMPPPLTPEQQALVISGMGAISITLFACYVFNLGAHS